MAGVRARAGSFDRGPALGCNAAAAAATSSQATLKSVLQLATDAATRECSQLPEWCSREGVRAAERSHALALCGALSVGAPLGRPHHGGRASRPPARVCPATHRVGGAADALSEVCARPAAMPDCR